ncbi:MAG TPA: 30S ribosomal protein S6 [Candidatus Paceibacterota bacterium]
MEDTNINTYELSFLLRDDKDIDLISVNLSNIGAEISTQGTISELKLSYPIEKTNNAYFGYVIFKAEKPAIAKLNNALKLEKKILRFLIVTPPPVDPNAPKAEDASGIRQTRSKVVKSELSNKALEEKLAALRGTEEKPE